VTDTRPTSGRFLVLLALAHGPKHGYEIARHLEDRSRGVFTLSFGALYPVLHRLEAEGLAAASWRGDGARKKKVYALTAAGVRALADEKAAHDRIHDALARLA
jgi:PadR family transcriptional regulator PadR